MEPTLPMEQRMEPMVPTLPVTLVALFNGMAHKLLHPKTTVAATTVAAITVAILTAVATVVTTPMQAALWALKHLN
jgi:hypothetical protein